MCKEQTSSGRPQRSRASDFFQDWLARVTHAAKHGGSFSELMGLNHIRLFYKFDIW